MAASAIAISSDSLDESVGSPPSQVILFGDIPTVIPSTSMVAPETSTIAPVISSAALVVETTLVASPIGLCGLVPYSGSDSNSSDEMSSPEHISSLPAISPFLCTDSFEAPDSSDGPPSQDPYVATVAHQAHSGSSTRDVSPRLCYPPRRAPRRSQAFLHWCAAPLSTLYPQTTSESSLGNSSERPLHSSSHSARPSRKRCRFPVDFVPSSTLVMGSLAPTRADLLPPRKRFRDSYLSEASIEEDTEIDPIETEVDMELGIGDGDDVRDHVEIDPRDVRDDIEEYEADTSIGDTVEVGIDPMSALIVEEEIVEPVGEDSSDSSGTRDGIVRSFEDIPIDLDDAVREFYHHMSEVRIDRIVGIEAAQRRLEADQLIARGQRVSMIERIDSLRLENLKEEFHQVRRDHDDTRERLRRLESYVDRRLEARRVNRDLELGNGNGNGNSNGNNNGNGNGNGTGNGNNGGDNDDGNENRNVNRRGDRHVARECTYQDFMKCQPLSFKGIEGVWNSHKRTIGTDATYALSWRELLKLMTEVYCPRNKIQKMETELWNLSVKNNDMATYTQRFQELTMMCTKMVPEGEDRVEKFIGGLPDNIQGNVIAAEPIRLQDVV
ncbi:putative reverse transcriptase domain-containing protein [Tanacetum coccineum]